MRTQSGDRYQDVERREDESSDEDPHHKGKGVLVPRSHQYDGKPNEHRPDHEKKHRVANEPTQNRTTGGWMLDGGLRSPRQRGVRRGRRSSRVFAQRCSPIPFALRLWPRPRLLNVTEAPSAGTPGALDVGGTGSPSLRHETAVEHRPLIEQVESLGRLATPSGCGDNREEARIAREPQGLDLCPPLRIDTGTVHALQPPVRPMAVDEDQRDLLFWSFRIPELEPHSVVLGPGVLAKATGYPFE